MAINMMVGGAVTILPLWFGQGWIGGLLAYRLGSLTATLLSLMSRSTCHGLRTE